MEHPLTRRAGLAAMLLEAGLWLCAVSCGVTVLLWHADAHAAQRAASAVSPLRGSAPEAVDAEDAVIGRLEISPLKFSVPILRNYDPASLRLGVGHIPGTAVPGGLGNFVLAGHRDTFFRPLRDVHPGMVVQITTSNGRWSYTIDRTEVVDPDRVDVLEVGDRPEMTLITCYPFEYVGAAPRRFIVYAHLESVDPAE